LLLVGALFIVAGLCEIGGGYLVRGWMRDHKPLAWARSAPQRVPLLVPQPARGPRRCVTAGCQLPKEKPCKIAVYDGGCRSTEIVRSWLRIRRPQVRVLPSAPL
jgi:hypothetical protein